MRLQVRWEVERPPAVLERAPELGRPGLMCRMLVPRFRSERVIRCVAEVTLVLARRLGVHVADVVPQSPLRRVEPFAPRARKRLQFLVCVPKMPHQRVHV